MRSTWRLIIFLAIGPCLLNTACNGPIYIPDRVVFSDALTPRSRWLPSGDLRDPFNAVDNNINTAALSDVEYQNAAFTIDLGKVCQLNMIILEHGADEFGFCRKLAVSTSYDGQRFRRETVVPGLRRVTTVVLVKQVLARYVRLEAIEPGHRRWSIAEIHIN